MQFANEKQLFSNKELGLSLIELLVSMTVGLFILSGVVAIVGNSKTQFIHEEDISYIQENARFAIDQIAYDVRMAGYFGCSAKGELTNSVDDSTDASNWFLSSNGIRGFEIGDSDFPAELTSTISAGTDVLIVNRAEPNDAIQVSSHNPSSATIHLTASTTMERGDVLLIASPTCSNMAIFQMTGPTSSNPSHVNHSSGGSVSPGNCHKALSSGYDCDSSPHPSFSGATYPPGSFLMEFVSHAYFVRESDTTGIPSLYRQTLVNSSNAATTEAQELVSGVEDLEIIYGVDTNATDPDGIVDRYYSADQITALTAASGTAWVGWDRVMSARVTLIMRSTRELFNENTAVDLGEGYTFNDRFMRQKVTTTIRIRNRGLGAST